MVNSPSFPLVPFFMFEAGTFESEMPSTERNPVVPSPSLVDAVSL